MISQDPHNDRREGPESAGDEGLGGGGQCPKLFSTINQGELVQEKKPRKT